MSNSLSVDYFEDEKISKWHDNLDFVMETLSSEYSYEKNGIIDENGPGLLVVQLSTDSIDQYASAMDLNPWEDADVSHMDENPVELYELFEETCKQDGALIVASNGKVLSSNAYLEPPIGSKNEAETFQGMGAKHIVASRMSTLDEVVYTKALSSTTGDITTFRDGSSHKVKERESFADKWYIEDSQ